MTALTNAQAAEYAAVAGLPVELVAGHARHRAPHVLCRGHVAMLLEAGKVDLVQRRRNVNLLWRRVERRLLIAGHEFQRSSSAIGGGDEVFQRCHILLVFYWRRRKSDRGWRLG